MKNNRILIVLLISGIALIGGAVLISNIMPDLKGAEPEEIAAESPLVLEEEVLPTSTVMIADDPTQEPAAEPTEEVLEIIPTPRTEMEGTDPSTVVLASGDIQLVEFFAFW